MHIARDVDPALLPHVVAGGVRFISELFPLTHFCRAFRLINFQSAGWSYLLGDLAFLLLSTVVCCIVSAFFLQRAQD